MQLARLARATFAAMPAFASVAAAGCTLSSDGIVYSPDTGAISLLFDSFEATRGKRSNCVLSIPTRMPTNGVFSVYSADYSGFINEGDIARLTVEQRGSRDGTTLTVPQTGALFRTYVGTFGASTINSKTVLGFVEAGDPSTFAQVDTIDYALGATTTLEELQNSISQAASARTATLVHMKPVAELLTGANRAPERPDELALIGAAGSYLVGLSGHQAVSDKLVLDGGLGLFSLLPDDQEAKGAMAAANLRYLWSGGNGWKPFVESGASASALRLRFAREYDDGTEAAGGSGSPDGLHGGLHGGAGLLFLPGTGNQFLIAASVDQDWLQVDSYSEAFSANNFFAASFEANTTTLTTLKLGASWTASVAHGLDMTLNAGAGHGWSGGELQSQVSFAGPVIGRAQDDNFVTYGAKFGYTTPLLRADLFAQGVTGNSSATEVLWGGTISHRF